MLRDNATPAIAEKLAKCRSERVARRVLVACRQHWRNHLAGMPRNRHGYPSTGFYEGAARDVERSSYAAGGLVVLRGSGPPGRPGLRQRYYGGPIEAENHANITIPICAEAYGTTVKDWGFDNLTLVILADGRKFYALWLGDESVQKAFSRITGNRAGSVKFKGAETTVRRVQKLPTSSHPKVIIFKQGGAATGARAAKHMPLKFLFRLMPKTADQAANPDVIPDDLGDVAAEAITEAISEGAEE